MGKDRREGNRSPRREWDMEIGGRNLQGGEEKGEGRGTEGKSRHHGHF